MNKKLYVYLGRFSPFHLGHQKVLSQMVERFGNENVLVLIGSSTSRNQRTPYTFDQRQQMINAVFPNVKILPLPDTEPGLVFFREDTNSLWLKEIKSLEKQLGCEFVFVGGSKEDLRILSQEFETVVVIERTTHGNGYSATTVRHFLESGDFEAAREMLDGKIFDLALSGFNEFKNLPGNP